MVVFGQSGCIRTQVVELGNKWLRSGKVDVIKQTWLYLGSVDVFCQK